MAKTYAQERYGIECPKRYSKKPKPKNDPKISNSASAVCSVVIIVSRSSANSTVLTLEDEVCTHQLTSTE